jgi:hypothetical protein
MIAKEAETINPGSVPPVTTWWTGSAKRTIGAVRRLLTTASYLSIKRAVRPGLPNGLVRASGDAS